MNKHHWSAGVCWKPSDLCRTLVDENKTSLTRVKNSQE
jgi:hypothetical protein